MITIYKDKKNWKKEAKNKIIQTFLNLKQNFLPSDILAQIPQPPSHSSRPVSYGSIVEPTFLIASMCNMVFHITQTYKTPCNHIICVLQFVFCYIVEWGIWVIHVLFPSFLQPVAFVWPVPQPPREKYYMLAERMFSFNSLWRESICLNEGQIPLSLA